MTIADIETLTRFLTKTNTTSFTAANLLILENKYYEEIVGKIISETAGADTQFGDFNYTSFPTFTQNLVNSQSDYPLTGVSTRPLTIMGVEVLNDAGTAYPLTRTSLHKIHELGLSQSNYQPTDGAPTEHEIRDNIMVLYPAPDDGVSVTLASGLITYYLRTADIFTSAEVSTGTKVPGFPTPWHDLMSYGPAYDYAITNGLPNANFFKREYDSRLKEMLDFISKRDQDVRTIMSGKKILYK